MNPELIVRGVAIVIGLVFGAIGVRIMLVTLGVFGEGAESTEAHWVGMAAGLAFILGGLGAIVTYGIAGGARLEDDAALGIRLRVRVVQLLLALGIVVAMATIMTFVALGPARGSLAAGASCVALWVFVVVMAGTGVRRLARRRSTRT